MAEEIGASQQATQPQTQTQPMTQFEDSQAVEAEPPNIWGRLYPAPIPDEGEEVGSRTLGLRSPRHPPSTFVHRFTGHIDLIEDSFKVGRSTSCNCVISSENIPKDVLKISQEHFQIIKDLSHPENPVILHDLSSNGTLVNGKRVGKGKKRILETNDVISVLQPNMKIFIFMNHLKNRENVPLEISQKYFISKELGQGAFGTVRLIYNKFTCERYAMKIVPMKKLNGCNKSLEKKIMSEINILRKIDHPFIIKTEEIITSSSDAVYMILELMEGGELFDLVSSVGKLDEHTVKVLFLQIALAVDYLHRQGIAHRDLKPENLLLGSKDRKSLLVKITDFGLSKILDNESMKTMCGTPFYVAPEILQSKGKLSYSKQVDVWSLGVILFICLSGYHPFSQEYKPIPLHDQITKGMYRISKPRWASISNEAQHLVRRMLTVDPEQRITMSEILKHPWLKDQQVVLKVTNFMKLSKTYPSPIDSFSSALKRSLSGIEDDPVPKRRRVSGAEHGESSESTVISSSSS